MVFCYCVHDVYVTACGCIAVDSLQLTSPSSPSDHYLDEIEQKCGGLLDNTWMRNSGKYLIEDKDDKVRDVDNFTTVLNLKWGDLFCVTRHTLPCNRLLCYSTALRRPSDNYFVCPANLLATGFVYLRLSMDIYNGHLVLMFVSFICAVTLSCRNSCLTYAYLYMSAGWVSE